MIASNTLDGGMARAQLVEELLRLRPHLARLGVASVALFGSRAREDHRKDSDIDLIVDVDRNHKFSLLDLVAVEHVIEDHIGLSANVFMRRSLDAEFLESARRDEVVVFGD